MKKLLTSRLGLKNKALPILTVALVAVLCFAGQAAAGPVYTLDDSYWGGNNYYNPNNGDSIGGKPFTISDALVSRDGNQLTVIIETDYASHNGLENTYYGDLFLNPIWAASSRNNTNDPHYTADAYHPGDWSFAVHLLGDLGHRRATLRFMPLLMLTWCNPRSVAVPTQPGGRTTTAAAGITARIRRSQSIRPIW
ncbi:MAG: hypothetical protein IPL59_15530 [Candidatus Competibacteraceae bacterium]|nr:hypothetical protein [Candidatus Competibacteraceae bacterium]